MEEESKFSADSSSSDLLHRAQALHTALCYLCSLPADVAQIETFLFQHPEALLLEGVSNHQDETAAYILNEQDRFCQCSSSTTCRQNRRATQHLLRMGFSYFQAKGMQQARPSVDWGIYEEKLMVYERDVRILRQHELTTRQFALEATLQMQKYQEELHLAEQYQHQPSKFRLAFFFPCGKHPDEQFARRSVLEYQIELAAAESTALNRQLEVLLSKIRCARRLQFALLKKALPCSTRHLCKTRKMMDGDDVSTVKMPFAPRKSVMKLDEFSI